MLWHDVRNHEPEVSAPKGTDSHMSRLHCNVWRLLSLFIFAINTIFVVVMVRECVVRWKSDVRPDVSEDDSNIASYPVIPGMEDIDCLRIIKEDFLYIEQIAQRRRTLYELFPYWSDMSCDGIRERVIGPKSPPTINYPIAFARNVYKQYKFIEFLLSSGYSTENQYCYAIDVFATNSFVNDMMKLAECLPNVHIISEQLRIDSNGHNTNKAHLKCIELLLTKGDWHYVMLLQNHDIILNTNAEMAEIFKIFNGTNDIQVSRLKKRHKRERINTEVHWLPDHLNMFNEKTPLTEEEREEAQLKFAYGQVSASISRKAAEWMIHSVNLTQMMEQFDSMPYGVDEQLLPTLQNSDSLKMPGGYHHKCVKQGHFSGYITRYSRWLGRDHCNSGYARHSVCIIGVEDVPLLDGLVRHTFLSANKVLPNFDFTPAYCIAQSVFNRTFGGPPVIHNRQYFENLSAVRYNREKQREGFNVKEWIQHC